MDNNDLKLIEKYLAGSLCDADKAKFITKLKYDEDFRKNFESLKKLNAGIRMNVLDERLKALKNNIQNNPSIEKSQKNILSFKFGIILIGMLSILAIVFYSLKEPRQNTNVYPSIKTPVAPALNVDSIEIIKEKIDSLNIIKNSKPNPHLFASTKQKGGWKKALSHYINPQIFGTILRDNPSQDDEKLTSALIFYENKKYKEALESLGELKDDQSKYLAGHCLFLAERTHQAAKIFRAMADDDFSTYHEDAKWNLALCLYADYPQNSLELMRLLEELKQNDKYRNDVLLIEKDLKSK